MNKLNPSIKHHVWVGLFSSLWIFVFTYIIKPFDSGKAGLEEWWLFLSIGFSFITFLSYFIAVLVQDNIYVQLEKWNIGLEISILLLFFLLNHVLSYAYYKSPFLKGIWNFSEFSNALFKSLFLFAPIVLFARWFILRFVPQKVVPVTTPQKDPLLTIKGEYKLDILKIQQSELICISKSQNYVEVFFLEQGISKSKLIRSSLKKIQQKHPFLIQVHRSHLVNPTHFKSWKSANTLSLTHIEIPVSKNYKNNTVVFHS
ncbi:LytTR family DNA-binding domain-containing protein [uncultured Tenacibaculum sp.]|uniref:LytTR family DNA-binding domain-containing protein n=1 Tax=uncultured Tenacibaculum sp. TaxID=174713 RepID=UPI00260E65C5|nr:LytTR family DNA-binding domain-containing protein [uncultured Tenacibaculum sp.]